MANKDGKFLYFEVLRKKGRREGRNEERREERRDKIKKKGKNEGKKETQLCKPVTFCFTSKEVFFLSCKLFTYALAMKSALWVS